MKIERVMVDSLMFDPSNARTHSPRNIKTIHPSLAQSVQHKPLVLHHANIVLAGNGTLQAAKNLNWKHISIYRTELSGPEAMAFALADNKTAELAEWDDEILNSHLEGFINEGWDMEEFGFDLDLPEEKPPKEKKHKECPNCGELI